jgi:hypothetical protein
MPSSAQEMTLSAYSRLRGRAEWLRRQKQRERQLSDQQLAIWLGLDATGILRLALWPRPRAKQMEQAIRELLSHVGGNPETMSQLLKNAWAGDTPDSHMLQSGSASVAAAAERCARYRQIARALVERAAQPLGLDEGGVGSNHTPGG